MNRVRRKLRRTTKRRKLRRTTMAEDLILEIVARLPLKYAVRCSLLNKSICRSIASQPDLLPHCTTMFYSDYNSPTVFKIIKQEVRSIIVDPPCKSVNLDTVVYIKASCNGLLLLRVNNTPSSYFIFNPATTGIVAIDHGIEIYTSFSLAVPRSGCKLVGLQGGHRFRFTVFVPGSDGWMTGVSQLLFDPVSTIQLMTDDDSRPVYANDTLYWLGNGGQITVSFDVEKMEARSITGPVLGDEIVIDKWFGFTNGSIYFVYTTTLEIVVCVLNGGEWHVKKRISKPGNSIEAPLYLVGDLLFVFQIIGGYGDLLQYDLVTDLKLKINKIRLSTVKPKIFLYTSTFAQVSNYYLNGQEGDSVLRKDLLELQKLLVPTAVDTTPFSSTPPTNLIHRFIINSVA